MSTKIIFHIDMNSYFASVEQQANPHLRGKPMGVCEHLGGIIIAPSIEAKRLGITTGTPVWEAKKIWPSITLLPVDPPKYRHVTQSFLKIFSDYSSLVERYSIDEAFLDVSHLTDWKGVILYALEIKQRIRQEIGQWLTCSVGAGPNKLLAKIASDLEKPDGAVIIPPWRVGQLYERLKLNDIPGIATRMQRRLNSLGVFSITDLARYPESKLHVEFGIVGHYLHEMGNFRGSMDLITPQLETIKSMGHAYTLPKATSDLQLIKKLFFKLSEKIARRMRLKNFWGSVIRCYVRYAATVDGQSRYFGFGKSRRIKQLTNDGKMIFREAYKLFDSFPNNGSIRMAGVSVGGLVENVLDEPLFEQYKKPERMLRAIDCVNEKYGDFTLRRAVLLDSKDLAGDTVGFGRMKETQES